MARCLVFALLFLALALLPSRTAEALTLRDLCHLVLPHNLLPQEATPHHLLRGVTSTPNTEGNVGDEEAVGGGLTSTPNTEGYGGDEEAVGGAETRVDFGTKSWPHVYYARRDQKGTVDWGTRSWPYVFYSRQDGKGHKGGKPGNAADAGIGSAAKPVTVHHGRKVGGGFRI